MKNKTLDLIHRLEITQEKSWRWLKVPPYYILSSTKDKRKMLGDGQLWWGYQESKANKGKECYADLSLLLLHLLCCTVILVNNFFYKYKFLFQKGSFSVFRASPVSVVSLNYQLKIILLPQKHIWGYHILLTLKDKHTLFNQEKSCCFITLSVKYHVKLATSFSSQFL